MKSKLLLLVVGLAAGVAGGYAARPSVDRLMGQSEEVEGVVVDERREEDRLILTLRAGEETLLASFHERADDVEGLVAPGDYLTVRVGARGVFADEVPIVRLRRAADLPAPDPAEPADEHAHDGDGPDEADEDDEADGTESGEDEGEPDPERADPEPHHEADEAGGEVPVAASEPSSRRRRRDG